MAHDIYVTHLHAQSVSNSAFGAGWAGKGSTAKHLLDEARKNMIMALAGEPAGTSFEQGRAALIDLIAMAIVGSTDIDCTAESQAEAILTDILDNCLPVPKAGDAIAAE